MKTAVSVPNDVYERAERLARASGRSRSEVYSAALREYVARHAPDEVADAIDEMMQDLGGGGPLDDLGREAARRALVQSDW